MIMDVFKLHKHCINYLKDSNSIFEIIDLEKGANSEFKIEKNEIVFVLKGRIRFCSGSGNKHTEHKKGTFLLLDRNNIYRYKVSNTCRLFFLKIEDIVRLCENYALDYLLDNEDTLRMKDVTIPLLEQYFLL